MILSYRYLEYLELALMLDELDGSVNVFVLPYLQIDQLTDHAQSSMQFVFNSNRKIIILGKEYIHAMHTSAKIERENLDFAVLPIMKSDLKTKLLSKKASSKIECMMTDDMTMADNYFVGNRR